MNHSIVQPRIHQFIEGLNHVAFYTKKISNTEYLPRWEQFRAFALPLEVPAIAGTAPVLTRFFRTIVLRENEHSMAKQFARALETEVYSLVALHKSAQTTYGKVYTQTLYQFARGLCASLKDEDNTDQAGWLDLLDQNLARLSQMNHD